MKLVRLGSSMCCQGLMIIGQKSANNDHQPWSIDHATCCAGKWMAMVQWAETQHWGTAFEAHSIWQMKIILPKKNSRMTTRSNLIFCSVIRWGPRTPYPATKLHRNGAAPNRGSLKQKNSETKGTWSSETWNGKNPSNGKNIEVYISNWSERWKMSDGDKSARYNIKF